MRNTSLPYLQISSIMITAVLMTLYMSLPIHAPSALAAEAPKKTRDMRLQAGRPKVQWPNIANRYALVIGVDEYQDTQINRLDGASNDARAIGEALVRHAGFPPEQVILLASDQPVERRPTRGNILRRLSNLRVTVPKDGLLLVAFAGHGIEREGRAYLLPSDAQVSGDVALLEDTAINVEAMRERIRQTEVGQVVMIMDACRNDPMGGRAAADNPMTAAYTRAFSFEERNREIAAFATIYATEVGYRAYEYKEKKQGYFTWALVEGLKGGAANDKGEVTLAGLVRHLQEAVPKRISMDLGKDKKQRPFAVIGGYKADELVIAVTPAKQPGASSVEAGETLSTQQLDAAAIELSFWDSIKNGTDPKTHKAYLQKYPNGHFAELARSRVDTLENSLLPVPNEKPRRESIQQNTGETGGRLSFEVSRSYGVYSRSGYLYISPNGVQYKETGRETNSNDDFSASCTEVVQVKSLNSIADPMQQMIQIGLRNRAYSFRTPSRAIRDSILEALSSSCGRR